MLATKGISEGLMSSNLQITKGDIADLSTIKAVLTPNGTMVDMVISGLGSTPSLKTTPDWTVCERGVKAIIDALAELNPTKPPFATFISTTGISKGPRDVPYLFGPLYHIALASPHKDKRAMEEAILQAATSPPNGKSVMSGYTIVRASLLIDMFDGGKIKVGTQEKPRIGYSISRNGVGKWIFDDVIAEGGTKWADKVVTVTY
ncbi:hypothetical protein MMC13_006774 [Lambiella insularis]|nr:hypothetical protein [Lambiella insularis]